MQFSAFVFPTEESTSFISAVMPAFLRAFYF